MTVTRLGQVTAETGSPGEYAKITGTTVTLNSTISRSGFYCWACGAGAGVGLTFPVQSGIRANFAARYDSFNLGGDLLYLHSSGSYAEAVSVHIDDTEIKLITNGVVRSTLGTVAVGFTQGAWHDVGIVYQSGAAGFVSVYLDGNLLATYTANLVGSLDYLVTQYRHYILDQFSGSYLDDLYVDSISADEPDHVPSAKKFLSSSVTGEGVVQWSPVGDTPNYRCVDEIGVPDNDTTYVKTLVPGVQDLYTMSPVVLPTDYHIRAVIPTAIAKKGDTSLNALISPVIFDGLDTLTGDPQPISLSYSTAWFRFPTQPDGAAWNETDYEAMQYGMLAAGSF